MMKLQKKSLAEEVAEKIQEQISSGHYKINDKLPIEPELMKSFGVGRSSIREAIKLLTNSGLLRVQQGLGTFVERSIADAEPLAKRLQRAKFEDLDEVRQLLEMKIAEKAAVNRTDEDINQISQALEQRNIAAQQGLLEVCIAADIRFHTAIAEASGNEILADLYKSVAVHLEKGFLQSYTDTAIFEDTYQLHEKLLRAITRQDAKKAWSLAAEIIGHGAH
ncbi:FadR/GntR family transcriptional regulator [Arcticibacter sp. MXS-1]|uniref:FadR/GntR family transcriptional regulator n=1 Tax=Arcticibacter sp. MXS-1 TaxID=3341726 RepID=UPI0035A98063